MLVPIHEHENIHKQQAEHVHRKSCDKREKDSRAPQGCAVVELHAGLSAHLRAPLEPCCTAPHITGSQLIYVQETPQHTSWHGTLETTLSCSSPRLDVLASDVCLSTHGGKGRLGSKIVSDKTSGVGCKKQTPDQL